MMIRKLKRNRATAAKTKFDLQVTSVSIPAVPKMKEITKNDYVNISIERNGKIITHTEDEMATYNPRDNGISLKFKNDMSIVSTMYRDSSNTKYIEKKAKIQLRVKNNENDKYNVVGDADLLLDELATIYDTTVDTVAVKTLKIKNCSVPGVVLTLKFNVSTIGKDDVNDTSFETDSVISDATMEQFEDIDLKVDSSGSFNSHNSSSSSVMDKYNEERLLAKNLSTNSSVPKATIGDYSRRGSRGDSDFLRNENKYLQEDVEKYKAQCVKLNEEIEHLHDRLAEADKKASRLAREKDELSRSMNAALHHSPPPKKTFMQKLFSCGNSKHKKRGSSTYDKNFDNIQPQPLSDDEDIQMLSHSR